MELACKTANHFVFSFFFRGTLGGCGACGAHRPAFDAHTSKRRKSLSRDRFHGASRSRAKSMALASGARSRPACALAPPSRRGRTHASQRRRRHVQAAQPAGRSHARRRQKDQKVSSSLDFHEIFTSHVCVVKDTCHVRAWPCPLRRTLRRSDWHLCQSSTGQGPGEKSPVCATSDT